jgi:aspartate racemase
MKTIGLLGGMSWESTVTYYQIINEAVKERLGGFHSAKCLLYSVDFQEIEACQVQGDWVKSAEILGAAAQSLERGGADFVVLCTNTMHKVAWEIQKMISIPLLHIAEVTAQELNKQNIARVALLGTSYTMEQDFYKNKLIEQGIDVLIPDQEDRDIVNHVIFNELCLGKISGQSKKEYLRIIDQLSGQGAKGVILGCTEIGLLIKQADTSIPVFDTTKLHALQAVELALGK